MATETGNEIERRRLVTPFLGFICFVMLMIVIIFAYQSWDRNRGLDDFHDQVNRLEVTVNNINKVAQQVNNPEAQKAQAELLQGLHDHITDSEVARGSITEQMNEICKNTGWCTPR